MNRKVPSIAIFLYFAVFLSLGVDALRKSFQLPGASARSSGYDTDSADYLERLLEKKLSPMQEQLTKIQQLLNGEDTAPETGESHTGGKPSEDLPYSALTNFGAPREQNEANVLQSDFNAAQRMATSGFPNFLQLPSKAAQVPAAAQYRNTMLAGAMQPAFTVPRTLSTVANNPGVLAPPSVPYATAVAPMSMFAGAPSPQMQPVQPFYSQSSVFSPGLTTPFGEQPSWFNAQPPMMPYAASGR